MVEEGCERSDVLHRKHDATESEYWARIVNRVRSAHIGTHMTELVQIREIYRVLGARNAKARALARASEVESVHSTGRPTESVDIAATESK